MYHQILRTTIRRNVWHSVRRLYISILAVNGLKLKSLRLAGVKEGKNLVPLDPFNCCSPDLIFLVCEVTFWKLRVSYLEELPRPRKYNRKHSLSSSFGNLELSLELRMEMLTNIGSRALCPTNIDQQCWNATLPSKKCWPSMLERWAGA